MAQVKELNEVLDGMAVLAELVGKVLGDGKVSFGDAKYALDLLDKKDVLIEAFKGIDDIDDEIKDLNAEEAQELLVKVFALVAAYKEGKAEA